MTRLQDPSKTILDASRTLVRSASVRAHPSRDVAQSIIQNFMHPVWRSVLLGLFALSATSVRADDPERPMSPPPPKPTVEQGLQINTQLESNLIRFLTDESIAPEKFIDMMNFEIGSMHEGASLMLILRPKAGMKSKGSPRVQYITIDRKLLVTSIAFDADALPNEYGVPLCLREENFRTAMLGKGYKYKETIWQPHNRLERGFETKKHSWISRITFYPENGCLHEVIINRGFKEVK